MLKGSSATVREMKYGVTSYKELACSRMKTARSSGTIRFVARRYR